MHRHIIAVGSGEEYITVLPGNPPVPASIEWGVNRCDVKVYTWIKVTTKARSTLRKYCPDAICASESIRTLSYHNGVYGGPESSRSDSGQGMADYGEEEEAHFET